MRQISTSLSRPFTTAVLTAALLAAATAPAADAAVPKTGTWRGDLVHKTTDGFEYKSTMVLVEYRGRIRSVVATVRMQCGTPEAPLTYGVRDVRVFQTWPAGGGPKVRANGAYGFRADGAYFQGVLSRSSAMGGASANYGSECRGTSRHNLQRR